jgi:signal transduction histidine kinase
MKHILIATLGQSPRTVTETAGELVRCGVPLAEILMIRTRGSHTVPEEVRTRLPGVPPEAWNEVVLPELDVATPEDARQMAGIIYRTIEAQKRRPDVGCVHLDLTGGRKTMSAYMLLAAQFLLDEHDRVYHAEADRNRFSGDTWFPETDGEVRLLDVPFMRLGGLTPLIHEFLEADGFDPATSVDRAVEQLQRHVILGLMARGVEHEVHADLNILLGHLRRLDRQPDMAFLTGVIRHRIESIEGVVRSLLAVVEPSARLNQERAELARLVQEAMEEAQERYDIVCQVTGAGGPVRVDPLLIRRVFRIVLQNAEKANSRAVTVTLDRQDSAVCAVLEDDGDGMTPEECEDVFRIVKRLRRSGERRGVGLIVARRILEGYGGTITLESAPGRGTRVQITLPLDAGEGA